MADIDWMKGIVPTIALFTGGLGGAILNRYFAAKRLQVKSTTTDFSESLGEMQGILKVTYNNQEFKALKRTKIEIMNTGRPLSSPLVFVIHHPGATILSKTVGFFPVPFEYTLRDEPDDCLTLSVPIFTPGSAIGVELWFDGPEVSPHYRGNEDVSVDAAVSRFGGKIGRVRTHPVVLTVDFILQVFAVFLAMFLFTWLQKRLL